MPTIFSLNRVRSLSVVSCMVGAGWLAGCASPGSWPEPSPLAGSSGAGGRDVLFQVSTMNAVLEGVYDGVLPCGEFRRHGDAGTGTLDGLDGELIVVGGKAFQTNAAGQVRPVADDERVAFGCATFFEPDRTAKLKRIGSVAELYQVLDTLRPSPNLFYAVRVEGVFSHIKTRSVPKQQKPYPRLTEVTKTQPVFEYHDIRGTLVGVWFPTYAQGVNMPGYHLHFLSADHRAGGHLLDCAVADGEAAVDITPEFFLEVPTSASFGRAGITGDRAAELRAAEQGK